jgi:hypothetical protein
MNNVLEELLQFRAQIFSKCHVFDYEYFNDLDVQLLHYWHTNVCYKANPCISLNTEEESEKTVFEELLSSGI